MKYSLLYKYIVYTTFISYILVVLLNYINENNSDNNHINVLGITTITIGLISITGATFCLFMSIYNLLFLSKQFDRVVLILVMACSAFYLFYAFIVINISGTGLLS
jgi:hypothetical protein